MSWLESNGKMMSVLAAGATLCGVGAFGPTVRATLVAYEGFNYTAGITLPADRNPTTWNGGTGWSNTWNTANGDEPVIGTGSLSYGTLATTGNMMTVPNANSTGNGAERTLDSTAQSDFIYGGSATGTMWVSALVQQNYTGDNAAISLGNTQQYQPGITFGSFTSGGVSYYGMASNTTNVATAPVVTGTAAFLVLEINFTGNNNIDLTLYVDPAPGLTAPAAGTTSITYSGKPFSSSGGVNVTGTGWSFDELRFGTTYADVAPSIPEPATLALMAAAGTGILLRPRKRAGKDQHPHGTGPAGRDEEGPK